MTQHEKVQIKISAKDEASCKLKGIQSKVLAIGAAAASLAVVSRGLKSIISAAAESESAWHDVEAALHRHGMEIDSNLEKIKQFSDAMQAMTGESDEDVGKMVQSFMDYGQTVDEAMDTAKVAFDLAAGGGMNLKSATELLSKAAVGYTSTLSRYGIIIDENIPKSEKFAAAIEQINERFGGAAAARMDDTKIKLKLLAQTWGDLQEKIGFFVLPVLKDTVGVMNSLMQGMQDITKSILGTERAFESLGGKTKRLTGETSNLISEYQELNSITVKSEDEHQRLNDVVADIAKLLPNAVIEWNEYGEAISISEEKVKGIIEQQERFARAEFFTQIGAYKKEFKELNDVDISGLQDELKELAKERDKLQATPVDVRVEQISPKRWIDPLRSVQANIKSTKEKLNETSIAMDKLAIIGSTAFPDLEKDTATWNEAVTMLGADFANMVLEYQQGLEEIKKDTKTTADETADAFSAMDITIPSPVLPMEDIEFDADDWEQMLSEMTASIQEHNMQWQSDYSEHLSTLSNMDRLRFEESLIGLSTYDEERRRIEYEYDEMRQQLNEDTMMSDKEMMHARRTLGNLERAEINKLNAMQVKSNKELESLVNQSMSRLSSGIVDVMFDTKKNLKDVFESIGKDFMKFFIEKALSAVAGPLAGGIVKILGGLFDNPVNDRMAEREGARFAGFFTQGVLGGLGGANLGANISNMSAPLAAGANSGAETTQIINNFNGIVSEDFITSDVIPSVGSASKRKEVEIYSTEEDSLGGSHVFS